MHTFWKYKIRDFVLMAYICERYRKSASVTNKKERKKKRERNIK